jgi:hypothetical protein
MILHTDDIGDAASFFHPRGCTLLRRSIAGIRRIHQNRSIATGCLGQILLAVLPVFPNTGHIVRIFEQN